MKQFLRDVHHYLFNATFSPRAGVSYQVQDEIRRRTVAVLQSSASKKGPHVIVAHSLGSVIAYDCLKRVRPCPAVTSLMTIGSPLGIDEVQDRLRPEWTREDGYPSETLESQWITVYDSLDPVTGFDGNIANDFKKAGREVIEVINEENWGAWRHDAGKYLRGPKLRAALSHALDL
jgi:predicted alpha/beta hydrolase family esterase